MPSDSEDRTQARLLENINNKLDQPSESRESNPELNTTQKKIDDNESKTNTNTKKENGTGRNVLKETHILEYRNGEWSSYVEFTPLEDITIKTYYGFQWVTNTNYPNIRFIGGTNRELFTNSASHTSGDNIANGIRVYGDTHQAEIDLDTSYDIGDRRFYSGTAGAFNSTIKTYFYLISGLATASQGSLYCSKAKFIFSHV